MSETSQQSTPRMNVESFNLDHTKVAAPYVRVADRKELPGGDVLVKYDVRFCQPNRAHLEMEAVHSIEHLSAELMRNHTDRLIDFSPMGCQTGFYALMLGVGTEEFLPLLEATFRDILTAREVPAANEIQCGWGANHSLTAAPDGVERPRPEGHAPGRAPCPRRRDAEPAQPSATETNRGEDSPHSLATPGLAQSWSGTARRRRTPTSGPVQHRHQHRR